MSIEKTIATIKALSPKITARYRSEYQEYRVALTGLSPDNEEASAYYTDDAEDAIGTAKAMLRHREYEEHLPNRKATN